MHSDKPKSLIYCMKRFFLLLLIALIISQVFPVNPFGMAMSDMQEKHGCQSAMHKEQENRAELFRFMPCCVQQNPGNTVPLEDAISFLSSSQNGKQVKTILIPSLLPSSGLINKDAVLNITGPPDIHSYFSIIGNVIKKE